jgi:hypothetical protein
MFGLAFGQKDEQFSVISVPRTSDSEWVVKSEFTTEAQRTEAGGRKPEAGQFYPFALKALLGKKPGTRHRALEP